MSRVQEAPNRKSLEGVNSQLEPSIKAEIVKISETFGIQKVVLFGSRARGDFKKHSDIDLAVWMKGNDFEKADVISRIEDIETLLKIEFVIINSDTDEGLLESIERDGVTIYERY